MKYRHRKQPETVPKAAAWFLVIAGILLGTVFSFGTHYSESPVSKEEAVYTEAVFESYEKIYGRYTLNEIKVLFRDRDPLYIDGTCCSQTVLDEMADLKPGTVLCMYVHPNSNTLLDIQYGNNSILLFDYASEKLSAEVTGFLFLGIFMYLTAIYGSIKLIRKETF